ncbi:MAG TPA: hypothetical protein VKU00_23655 [Chthonomonadaceae bacterium]|nr:hypothetical protein [Chthonomonadaceae bacterium]
MKPTLFGVMAMMVLGALSISDARADDRVESRPTEELSAVQARSPAKPETRESSFDVKAPALVPAERNLTLTERYCRRRPNATEQPDQPLHIRLGLLMHPDIGFAGGLDYAVTNGARFTLRLDAESLINANTGGSSTLYPVTLNAGRCAPGSFSSRQETVFRVRQDARREAPHQTGTFCARPTSGARSEN